MSFRMRFNVHDIIRFDITGSSPRRGRYLANYYRGFLTEEEGQPDFELSMSDFEPDLEGCTLVGGKYYVKNNYFFRDERYKVVRWKFSFTDIASRPRISFSGGPYSDRFLREYVIDAVLASRMTDRGHCLLHASGVSIGQDAFVFAGTQHAGKTSTILNLLTDNPRTRYLGNDAMLLSAEGLAYDFPVPVHVYPYNLLAAPRISTRLSTTQKLRLAMNSVIFRMSNDYLTFPLEVPPSELFETGSSPHKTRGLFFLTGSAEERPRVIENGSADEIIDKLIMNNRHEMGYLDKCLKAYSLANPGYDADRHWRDLRTMLASILSRTSVFEVIIPRRHPEAGYRMVSDVMASLS